MKNIEAILADFGMEIPAEKAGDFQKAFGENYKTIAELNRKNAKIEELEDTVQRSMDAIKGLTAELDAFDGSEEQLEALKAENENLKKAEADRIAQAEQAKLDAILNDNIMAAVGDRQFTNKFVESSVLSQVKAKMQTAEYQGIGAGAIIDEIVNDVPGVFVNEQEVKPDAPLISEAASGSISKDATYAYLKSKGLA